MLILQHIITAFTYYKAIPWWALQGFSFPLLFSFLVDFLFAFFIGLLDGVPDISHSSRDSSYFSNPPACQLPQLPSSLAEFPGVLTSILFFEEKESFSFHVFCWISPFQYPLGMDSMTLPLHLVNVKLYQSIYSGFKICLTSPAKRTSFPVTCGPLP